jgi:tetratricopeptide (TPR) repeat protein
MTVPSQSDVERDLWNRLRCGDETERSIAAMRLGAMLRNRGELDAAYDLLIAAAAVGDRAAAARAWLALAEFLCEIGEEAGSRRAYNRASELADPERVPDVSMDLAARAQAHGNDRGAAVIYRAVIAAEPDPRLVSVAAVRLAAIHRASGDRRRGIGLLERARDLAGVELMPEVEIALAEMLLERSEEEASSWTRAVALLESAINVDHPDHSPRAALLLGRAFGARRRFTRAYELLQMVIDAEHPELAAEAEAEISALMRSSAPTT